MNKLDFVRSQREAAIQKCDDLRVRIAHLEARVAAADKLAEMDAARDFPANTCPASRHAQMIAEALIRGKPYAMLTEEPEHCGESIAAVVTALYEARSKLKQLEP